MKTQNLLEADLYRIFETNNFIKKISEIFKGNLKEVFSEKAKLNIYPQLKSNPFYGSKIKKLRDHDLDTWRYRIGDYRFFYSIDEKTKIVSMLDFDYRKDAY